MTIVAASQTYPVLRYSDHISLESLILSSSIVLPLEPFKRNFSRETRHSYLTNLFVIGYCGRRNTQSFPWGNLQRHTNPILVVNNLHMHHIPKFKVRQSGFYPISHMLSFQRIMMALFSV